jgi:hypothetical protein
MGGGRQVKNEVGDRTGCGGHENTGGWRQDKKLIGARDRMWAHDKMGGWAQDKRGVWCMYRTIWGRGQEKVGT